MSSGPATLADGRYELVRRIGRGASSEVWLAQDTLLGRQVAIKRADIPDYLGTAEQERIRRRLEREARAAARLRRPGVAPLFDVHLGDDSVDLVMAYIDAPTLHQLVADEGPLPDDAVARMGLTILSVLEEAHGEGVVHRDIKPSNVLVSAEGVRVTDFGIAAILDETALTRTGMAMGSPSYMAPEQAKGDEPAPAADLWGLGATLYYALTGHAPFDRQGAIATVHAVVNEPHQPIAGPHPLAGLIDRLLAKDPGARPSVAEIRGELERVAAGDGPSTPAGATRVMATVPAIAPAVEPTVVSQPPPTAPPPTAPPAAASVPAPGVRGRRLALLAGVLVLAGLGFVALTSGDPSTELDGVAVDDGTVGGTDTDVDGADGAAEASGDAAPDAPADVPAGDATLEAPATTEGPVEPGDDAAVDAGDTPDPGTAPVPEGWERFDGATYSVAHPAGWEVRDASGPRVDLVDPSSGAYLRIDWTDSPQPDPEADWRAQSRAFAQRHDGYEEIRIDTVDYRDAAALWEYRYTDGGAALHAYNLGFVAGDRGYALNFQTRESDWARMEPLFDDLVASFRPAG